MRCLLLLVCWSAAVGISTSLRGADLAPIQYSITFADADRHLIDVEAVIPTEGRNEITLMMPVWTPGSYLVREFARNVEKITAERISPPDPLELRKISKNRWTVATGGDAAIRLRYRLYCREMSVRTNWVEREFAMLNGPPTFITLADELPRPHRVRFHLPTRWHHSVSPLPAVAGEPHTYIAADFDTLVDSPAILGNPQIDSFVVGGAEHQLVTVGGDGLWDNRAAADDVQRIVAVAQRFWDSVPYERYIFMNVVGESRGGLEHDNSTVLMTSRWAFGDPEQYREWLGLVSHEFFHTWNVRRLRPLALARYDYEQEVYLDELWVAEGVTSYYDDLLQVHAGLLSEEDYFRRLSRTIEQIQTSPGREIQSLRESSHDTWIKFYRPDENAHNARISYYSKGALVAWLLDARIREATNGQRQLRDVMRALYDRHASEAGGYSLADFRSIVAEIAGEETRQWLETAVDGTGELDYRPALQRWGLQLGEPRESETEDESEPKSEAADAETAPGEEGPQESSRALASKPKPPYVGATVSDEAGRMVVTRIIRGGPADLAGWNVDDELLAVAGYRATPAVWPEQLAQFEIGAPIETLLSRRGELIERPLTLQPPRDDQWNLSAAKDATETQQIQRRQWLGGEPE